MKGPGAQKLLQLSTLPSWPQLSMLISRSKVEPTLPILRLMKRVEKQASKIAYPVPNKKTVDPSHKQLLNPATPEPVERRLGEYMIPAFLVL
jgi:hypothetical protein